MKKEGERQGGSAIGERSVWGCAQVPKLSNAVG